MQSVQPSACLVVTNPLHYLYVQRELGLPFIGSVRNTLLREYGAPLGFNHPEAMYDVPNTLHELIAADKGRFDNYIAWKAVKDAPLLGIAYELAHQLEQKACLRRLLPAVLFPKFTILRRGDIQRATYQNLASELGSDGLVVQVSYSTGGKGTYFIENENDFEKTRQILASCNDEIVISRRVNGVSYGVQCFIGKGGVIFPDWWHRDIVNVPDVCNLNVPDATRYCGAVLENVPDKYKKQLAVLLHQIGDELAARDYKGIFGVDLVLDEEEGKIYVIEINPRFTAVSHVYATAMRAHGYATDFMTASVREMIGDNNYDFGNKNEYTSLANPYYYLKLQNMQDHPVMISEQCRLGVYKGEQFVRFGVGVGDVGNQNEIVVIPEGDTRSSYAPGERTVSVIGVGNPFTAGSLRSDTRLLLRTLQKRFEK